MSATSTLRLNNSEADTRLAVAAGYRLVHLYGFSDFSDGFVSARIPSEPHCFIVGGYGLFPEAASASALFRKELDCTPVWDKGGVDLDAFRFTQMAFAAREGIHACIHAHPKNIIALSALETTILPMSQWGIMYGGRVEFMDFTTTGVTEPEPCAQMSRLLSGGASAIVLRNHGVLTVGKTVAQAFFALHRLELMSELQLQALQTGLPIRMPNAELANQLSNEYWTMTRVDNDGSREWPGLLAKLDRLDSAYRQ